MNRYRRASGNGSPGNNGFASHSMQPDAEGHLLLTDYEGKKIRVLDPALVNDDMANDASINSGPPFPVARLQAQDTGVVRRPLVCYR